MFFIKSDKGFGERALPPLKGAWKSELHRLLMLGNGWRISVFPQETEISMPKKGKLLVKGDGRNAIEIANRMTIQ